MYIYIYSIHAHIWMHTDTPHHQVRLPSLVFQEVDTEARTVGRWLVTGVKSGKTPKVWKERPPQEASKSVISTMACGGQPQPEPP